MATEPPADRGGYPTSGTPATGTPADGTPADGAPGTGALTDGTSGTGALTGNTLTERVHAASGGLARLIARAEAVQQERAAAAKERGAPRWTDVFTTQFTEFSNRPR